MESHDPRKPRVPREDDVAPGLPAIDGADADTALETTVELDVGDDEASALDDRASNELASSFDEDLDEAPVTVVPEDDEAAPVDADPSLAAGESERWTDGSDASEDTPWQEPTAAPEPTESSVDRGEEGFDDLHHGGGDALAGLPAAHAGDANDEDADELDVNEAGTLETPGVESEPLPALPRAGVAVAWHGPPREAARAIATGADGVWVAARGLWRIETGTHGLALPFESEVTAVLPDPTGAGAWIANEAGEVWTHDGTARRRARPGTDDASLGGLDLAHIAGVIVARTRGGALFRRSGDGWVGPIVARNVRRVRAGLARATDWLTLVVGSTTAPELLATRDARTFERLRGPAGEIAIDVSRGGDVVAVVSASGRLFVSMDAGATYARVDAVADVERVWARADGLVIAATFHEATDTGRLVRVRSGAADVLLDVEAEVATRRLSGPGEHDGDGRIHAIAVGPSALWVATGVGVFEIALDLDARDDDDGARSA